MCLLVFHRVDPSALPVEPSGYDSDQVEVAWDDDDRDGDPVDALDTAAVAAAVGSDVATTYAVADTRGSPLPVGSADSAQASPEYEVYDDADYDGTYLSTAWFFPSSSHALSLRIRH